MYVALTDNPEAVRPISSASNLKTGNSCFAQQCDVSFPNATRGPSQNKVLSQGCLEIICTIANTQLEVTLYRMK